EETLLVGVQDAHHRHFRQVETFAQKIDPNQGVERPLAKLAQDRDALERIELGMEPLAAQSLLLQVSGQVFGQPLGERRDQYPLAAARTRLDFLKQSRNLAASRLYPHDRINEPRRPNDLLDDLAP